jgi:hypothetical protein
MTASTVSVSLTVPIWRTLSAGHCAVTADSPLVLQKNPGVHGVGAALPPAQKLPITHRFSVGVDVPAGQK